PVDNVPRARRDSDRLERQSGLLQPRQLAQVDSAGREQRGVPDRVEVEREVEERGLVGPHGRRALERVRRGQRDGGPPQRVQRHGVHHVGEDRSRQTSRAAARGGKQAEPEQRDETRSRATLEGHFGAEDTVPRTSGSTRDGCLTSPVSIPSLAAVWRRSGKWSKHSLAAAVWTRSWSWGGTDCRSTPGPRTASTRRTSPPSCHPSSMGWRSSDTRGDAANSGRACSSSAPASPWSPCSTPTRCSSCWCAHRPTWVPCSTTCAATARRSLACFRREIPPCRFRRQLRPPRPPRPPRLPRPRLLGGISWWSTTSPTSGYSCGRISSASGTW